MKKHIMYKRYVTLVMAALRRVLAGIFKNKIVLRETNLQNSTNRFDNPFDEPFDRITITVQELWPNA